MPIFPEKLSQSGPCPTCGKETQQEKIGINYAYHSLATFFSFFLWLPVFLICAVADKFKPYRCVECKSPCARSRETGST